MFAKRNSQPRELDRRTRWGILLLAIAYSILEQNKFWERSVPGWGIALSIIFFLLAGLLSWTGVRALGRQWQIDAGLSSDHEPVMSGRYRRVRHPIYTSMPAVLVFARGTEIRVRIEDRLLVSRFGDRFRYYPRNIPAYIPFLR